jgi:hypothetical protein
LVNRAMRKTRVLRDAVEIASRVLIEGEQRREGIEKTIFSIANYETFDAPTLVNLAIEATEADRKTA